MESKYSKGYLIFQYIYIYISFMGYRVKGRVNDNHSPICRKRRTSFYYIRSLCRKTSWCVMSPFYKSHESSIRSFISYMRMYIYIYISFSLSSHSRINKLTHAIFLSLSLSLYHYSMRSLYNRLERGNKRIFIRISFSLKIFMKVPVDLESVVKQLAGKKIERIFVSPVLNLQKMTPSRRVSRIFVAVIVIDWNESWASNENLSLFFTFIYLSW